MKSLVVVFLVLSTLASSSPPTSAHLISTLIDNFPTPLLLQCRSSLPSSLPNEAIPTRFGYLGISRSSSFHYAFYEAQQTQQPSNTPLLLWLPSGPGTSSMIANFGAIGPWKLLATSPTNITLVPNPNSWNRHIGLLFIDSLIGTGYSYTDTTNADDVATDLPTAAKHLFTALQSFLSLDPTLRSRPLYIGGATFAARFVTSLAHLITEKNQNPTARINLQGIAIGNADIEPETQLSTVATTAYFNGILDENQKLHLESIQNNTISLLRSKNWAAAAAGVKNAVCWLQNTTQLPDVGDVSVMQAEEGFSYYAVLKEFLKQKRIAWVLGASNGNWELGEGYGSLGKEALVSSMKGAVEGLLEKKVRVLMFQGVYDPIYGVRSNEEWVKGMTGWDGIKSYLDVDRVLWFNILENHNSNALGYVQAWGPLTNVVMLRTGMTAYAYPLAQSLIENWVQGKNMTSFTNAPPPSSY